MGKDLHPLVSIVIPVYNGSNYLSEAINSALAQTYPNIEILVINDGSTDDGATHDIAMSYSDKIRYFQKENGGVVSALNFGIDQMRGEYFAWLSHDDLYQPEKIEKQVQALQKHKGPRSTFCICNCTFIDENGKELYRSFVRQDHEFDKPACFLFLGIVGFNGIMVLIPKILLDQCGQFTPSLATHEYDMWLRIMVVADVAVVPECLTLMRIHPQQVSNRNRQDAMKEIDRFIGNGIRDIPQLDFQNFVLSRFRSNGLQYVVDLLNTYIWYQHLPFSAVQTLAQLRLMFDKPVTPDNDLWFKLLGVSNIDAVRAYYLQRLHNDKSLVTIYCENVTDEVVKEISTGMALLSMQYDIALLYHQMDEGKSALLREINVMAIRYTAVSESMPLCLSVICYLLNARLFWYYDTGNGTRYAKTFHILKAMEICAIASFHDVNKALAGQQSTYFTEYAEPKKLLSEALLITSCAPQQALGSLYFEKLVVIPEDCLQALARWKMIFNVLLGATDYHAMEKKIDDQLSAVLDKTKPSLTEYVNSYVRDFIAEVDKRNAVLISAYEQRTFWKLTKPLRIGVWFFRKTGKAMKLIFKRDESMRSIVSRMRMAFKNRGVSI